VYELGACRVLKVYRRRPEAKVAAFREAATHAAVEALRLPVPAVRSVREAGGGRWGVAFDRVDGPSFAGRMRADPAAVPGSLEALARLQASIHGHAVDGDRFGSLKGRLAANIERAAGLDDARRRALLGGLAGMPEGGRLCHGDLPPRERAGRGRVAARGDRLAGRTPRRPRGGLLPLLPAAAAARRGARGAVPRNLL